MHILIAEDDATLRDLIADALRDAHFTPDQAATAREASFKLRTNAYDLAIVDWGFRGESTSGIDIVREVAASGKATPILMLTGRGALMDRMTGFRSGVDDYLVKPFYLPELVARVQAVIQRRSGRAPTESRIDADGVAVDLHAFELIVDDVSTTCNPKEYQLMAYLLRHRGQVVTRAELLERVWGDNDARTMSNTIDVHIRRLRGHLGRHASRIQTIRSVGYKFQ